MILYSLTRTDFWLAAIWVAVVMAIDLIKRKRRRLAPIFYPELLVLWIFDVTLLLGFLLIITRDMLHGTLMSGVAFILRYFFEEWVENRHPQYFVPSPRP